MVEIKTFTLPEVIDQAEILKWRAQIRRVEAPDCPDEVRSFITALAAKLGDFGQIGKEHSQISGYELKLSGFTEWNGEPVRAWDTYDLPVPRMVVVDHEGAMHRIFNKKGKQGLIDFCQAKVKGTMLERLLDTLNVQVFQNYSPHFNKVLAEINASKKLDG